MDKPYPQTSVYINLSSRQELSALCRTCNGDWVRSTLDLNSVLGNTDGTPHSRRHSTASNKTLVNAGTFDWTSLNFGASAKNVQLSDGKVLSATLKRKDGSWTESPVCVDLTEHITNQDGELCRAETIEEGEEETATIAPDVKEKLQAIAGMVVGLQAGCDNAAFELDYLVTANQRLVLQELEVAFLRLGKLAACIKGEFDDDVKSGTARERAEAVVRPMVRAFEGVAGRTERALKGVERIWGIASEQQTTGVPALRRDVEALRKEITEEVDGCKSTLEALRERIKESAAAVSETQVLLEEAKTTKESAKSFETLIKLSGWVLLPIGIGMNPATMEGPFRDAVIANEAKIKELEENSVKQQEELTSLTQQEASYHATLHAHEHLVTQLETLSSNVSVILSCAESTRKTIAATKGLMDALSEMAKELEDKVAMPDYVVSKREYAAYVIGVLDIALPWFCVVGEVEGVLGVLEEGDDGVESVKSGLKSEVEVVRSKLELVKLCE